MNDYDGRVESAIGRFDRQATAYHECMAQNLHGPGLRILGALESRRPRVVLDLGTGVGTLLPAIHASFPDALAFGCDGSRGMLAHVPDSERVFATDVRQLALAEDSVDLVLCVFVLLFLEEPLEALREVRRVLRPGGAFGTVNWGSEFEGDALSIWTECLAEQNPPEAATAEACDELVDTPAKLEALLVAAGFESVRAWTEEHVVRTEVDELIRRKTTMGRQKAQFDLLEPAARAACVASARERLGELGPDGLTARARIVHAVGE